MECLKTRYFLASVVLHLVLLSVLIIGPAFAFKSSRENDLPVLNVIPNKLIDDLVYGGGEPGPAPQATAKEPQFKEPEPQLPPKQQTLPKPTKTQVEVPQESVREQEQVPVKQEQIQTPKIDDTPKPKKQEIKVDLTPVVRKQENISSNKKNPKQSQSYSEEIAQMWNSQVSSIVGSLKKSLSSTTIEAASTSTSRSGSGTGGTGGEAYANYLQAIKTIYDRAWFDPPEDISDESLTTRVKIVIYKDGTVISAKIDKPSGNPRLDSSVERAISRVTKVSPFPEGSKENERIYFINFNLRSKRLSG